MAILSHGVDLVEVSPDSDPPVCRILDFGKYRYEQSKKEKANRARSKTLEMKEVRLGRSMKIDPHDISIRLDQARRFLIDGHKVQIVQNFRGREMLHKERGNERMQHVMDTLDDVAKIETPPRMAGRRMTMILAPDKTKIARIKQQEANATKVEVEHSEPSGSPLVPEEIADAIAPPVTEETAIDANADAGEEDTNQDS